jgi:hypothetical protein
MISQVRIPEYVSDPVSVPVGDVFRRNGKEKYNFAPLTGRKQSQLEKEKVT